jgi:PAS domain S-box-containing protein
MNRLIQLIASSATDPGLVRTANEDSLAAREPSAPMERVQKGCIWVIADGVGSQSRGLLASRLAVSSVIDAYWNSAVPDPAVRLRGAIERTNSLLFTQNPPGSKGPDLSGATILAGAIIEDTLYIAHVGRSRAYLLRAGGLQQLTQDHTWVAEQIRDGKLSPAEAATHPRRNMITRCLGIREAIQVDLIQKTILPGDVVLLASDGLYRHVDPDGIKVLLNRYGGHAASVLVEEAKRQGGQDNITTVTVAVQSTEVEDTSFDRMALINRLGRELVSSLNLDATLQSVAQQLITLTGGQRAAILIQDDRGDLVPRAAHSLVGDSIEFMHSHSVAQRALQEQRPILIANTLDDPLLASSESIVGLSLKSILCVPLIFKEEVLGALYVDSSAGPGMFDQNDVDLLVTFSAHAATAIQNARLHETLLERTREIEVARAQQDALFRSIVSALIAVDDTEKITHWNPAAHEILGIAPKDAIGKTLGEALPRPIANWLSSLILQSESSDRTVLMANEWEGPIANRPRVFLAGRVARIRDPQNVISGFVFILNDRTDLVLMNEARLRESEERKRVRELFSRYVAPSVVEQLLSTPAGIQLGGMREDVTILFADVRGFTGFSEQREPEEVVAMLNSYLALATTEIFEQLGTLDKFIGDGIMAIFGAPVPVENHPMAAVRAALNMRARLDELRRDTGVRVGFGIGLNGGHAIVGNIGTVQLMNYTAIGDVVNVAARLQAEARSGEILISEALLERVRDCITYEELGPLYVKGRAVPVMTYRVIGLAGDPAP